jgi:hypothetical protein
MVAGRPFHKHTRLDSDHVARPENGAEMLTQVHDEAGMDIWPQQGPFQIWIHSREDHGHLPFEAQPLSHDTSIRKNKAYFCFRVTCTVALAAWNDMGQ